MSDATTTVKPGSTPAATAPTPAHRPQLSLSAKPAPYATLPDLLRYVVSSFASSCAFNYREAGYWRSISTESFAEQVRRAALGLSRLGLKRGEAVGILAPPSPFWLIADLAIMSAGGVSVPLFPNLSDEHLAFESTNAGLRYLIVIGEPQWLVAEKHASLFDKVIVKGVHAAAARNVLEYKALLDFGDRASESDPGLYARLRAQIDGGDIATIIHTSGSTGVPKGVVLTHRNVVSQVHGACSLFPLEPTHDRALSCLPLAHVFERMVMYNYIAQGIPIYFADDVKNVGELLREVKPTVTTMVPRLIEKLHARIEKQAAEAHGLKRRLGQWALSMADDQPSAHHGWSLGVADALVYKKLRAALGGALRYLIVGGAALAPALERFLRNVGLPVYVGYGLTEASPCLAVNCPQAEKLGTVGKPYPGVEVRIGEQGEILARGPNVMRGYHRDPEGTMKVIDADGWLHTGDLGMIDDEGYLVITGRLKELMKSSNGKYVCPVPIEQALAQSDLIDLAMVIGEGRHFVSCLLFPDHDVMRRRKAALGSVAQSDEQYLATPAVQAEMQQLLDRVNAKLDRWEQVQKFRFVLALPTVEHEELTPTMKLRRHIIIERHKDLIESMYKEAAASRPANDAGSPATGTGGKVS
ncbi:MAG: long-chain fatty acid--CoA ligase [Planctomycetes bacterium]|nr:long-chain fatty acid--CoA ligase [Planctomycetota bacterium]